LPIDDFKENNRVVSRCLPFAKWPGRKYPIPFITDISLISALKVKGRDTKYCTIGAKDALLQEFKKLDSKKGTRSSFIKQKQIERDAIIVVSWDLMIDHLRPSADLTTARKKMPSVGRTGPSNAKR
jgi:hypothetical protein